MSQLLPKTAHTDQPWRIHEIAADFEVYDVWALPTPGVADDFPMLLQQFVSGDLANNPSRVACALFAAGWRLGDWLGWDDSNRSAGARVASLRDRLPEDLRDHETPDPGRLPFTSLYATDTEWAAEMANRTVHGVMHIGWVPDPDRSGCYRGQLAVLVKPNGGWGRAYLATIAPFRHLLVYPPLMRGIAASWRVRTAPSVETEHEWRHQLLGVTPPIRPAWASYTDVATLTTGSKLSARWWACTMFEELIHPVKRETLFRVVLALRPGRTPPTLMDWQVIEESDQLVRLERSGPLMDCLLTVESDCDSVRLGLSARPRNRLGAAVWSKVAPVHRRTGRDLLRRAWQLSQQVPSPTPREGRSAR